MRWRIKNPAPLDSRLKKWGDYHFGRSLAKHLRQLGEEVEEDYRPEWATDEACDVVLVLRGKFPLHEKARHSGSAHILWNLSHPELVSPEEYASYDMVLVASEKLALELNKKIDPPVHAFLQCTDTEEFFEHSSPSGRSRRDIVFVGNTREQRRDGVVWSVEEGFPVKIWGRGWKKWINAHNIMGDYVPNETLGELYSGARVTLNDHWPDMKLHGFINNRVFDALACGLPIISDRHPALEGLFPEEILYYSNREELVECFERCLLSYPESEEAARSAMERVHREFSFTERARRLLDLATSFLGVAS